MINWAVKTLFSTKKENKKIKLNVEELFKNVEGFNVRERELYLSLKKNKLVK